MPSIESGDDALARALAIAGDSSAQMRFAGSSEPQARSLWAKMNLKVKILALGIPAAAVFSLHPFSGPGHSLPGLSAAKSSSTGLASSVSAGSPQGKAAAAAALSAKDPLEEALGPNPKLSSYEISRRLASIDPFASLATAVESFKSKPYYDPGGLNVGMGYCVTKRLIEYGRDRVESDLAKAGFAPDQVESLVKGRKAEVSKIEVTPLMAARLMDTTRADYQGIAREGVGADVFDALPAHRQAAISYIAYNTGDVSKFKKLVAGLRSGADGKAMSNMAVVWRDTDGTKHVNHRLRSYVQAMFLGPNHFKRAIDDPNAFETHMASPSAESALAEIAEAAQTPSGLRSKVLERRMKENPWAFKAYEAERQKQQLPAAKGL